MANYDSRFTQDIADDICEKLADGWSLRKICEQEGMPAESTVRLWVIDDRQGFAAQYARARQVQYQRYEDEIIEIADDCSLDARYDEKLGIVVDHEHIARSRLRTDNRKWLLSKLLPKFGDKSKVELGGKDGAPVQFVLMGAKEEPSAAEWLASTLPSAPGDKP